MKISVKTTGVGGARADLLAVVLVAASNGEPPRLPRGVAALDAALGGVIKGALASGDVRGAAGEKTLLYPTNGAPTKRVLLLGAGDADALDAEGLRRLGATAASEARDRGLGRVALLARRGKGMDAGASAAALAEGAALGAYRYDEHQAVARKRGARQPEPKSFDLLLDRAAGAAAVRRAVARAVIGAESQIRARDLSNAPPNDLPPLELAAAARRVAREADLTCRVLKRAELERRGFGALLAVGQGSVNPPCLIVLEHKGAGSARRKPVCLVGKGITFDSGGLSLKPAASMVDMKHDMGGAATVIGAMRAAGLLGIRDHVVGIVAAAENMPSGTAYRPSDVVTSGLGKTIEITNTDAEGRVVLADALHYAVETFAPRAMIDVATLTGAAMIAFGPWATAAMANDERVTEGLQDAGVASGELIWPMPLLPEHTRAMKSTVADLKNSGGRDAGASTAAAFLKEFVGDTPWAHLDIAGTGWTTNRTPYHRGGATGVGVRMLVEWLHHGVQRFA